jgi:hypothetical protein
MDLAELAVRLVVCRASKRLATELARRGPQSQPFQIGERFFETTQEAVKEALVRYRHAGSGSRAFLSFPGRCFGTS